MSVFTNFFKKLRKSSSISRKKETSSFLSENKDEIQENEQSDKTITSPDCGVVSCGSSCSGGSVCSENFDKQEYLHIRGKKLAQLNNFMNSNIGIKQQNNETEEIADVDPKHDITPKP